MYEFDKDLLAVIFKSMIDIDYECGIDEKRGKIWLFETLKGGTINSVVILIRIGVSGYTVYWLSPFRVKKEDEETRKAIHEYFDDVNLQREQKDEYGVFEILPTGAIRFRNKVDCGKGFPDEKTITESLYCSVSAVEKWTEGMVAIICRGETDVKAVFDKYYPIVYDEQTQWLMDHFGLPDDERVKQFVAKFKPDEGANTAQSES